MNIQVRKLLDPLAVADHFHAILSWWDNAAYQSGATMMMMREGRYANGTEADDKRLYDHIKRAQQLAAQVVGAAEEVQAAIAKLDQARAKADDAMLSALVLLTDYHLAETGGEDRLKARDLATDELGIKALPAN